VPAATLRILARNVESDAFRLVPADPSSQMKIQLPGLSIELLDRQSRLNYARDFFKDATRDECLIERDYESIPPSPEPEDYGDFGGIPWDAEDLLFLLRLFRPGDLAFVSLSMQRPHRPPQKLYPYRVISDANRNSTRPFRIDRSDVPSWEVFAISVKSSPAWKSAWFNVARRWFLYGGAKEFNPNCESEVDRVADYVAALEAILVPKSDQFIQRQLKRRAVRLLGLNDEDALATKKLLMRFYKIRSTLVHGSKVSDDDLLYLQDRERWREFEQIVRDLLVAAVLKMPAGEPARLAYLSRLYEPNDEERAEALVESFKAINNSKVRRELICKIVHKL
jgi:hypothetical protein